MFRYIVVQCLFSFLLVLSLKAETDCQVLNNTFEEFQTHPFDTISTLNKAVESFIKTEDYESCDDRQLKSNIHYYFGVRYLTLAQNEQYYLRGGKKEFEKSKNHFLEAIAVLSNNSKNTNYQNQILKAEINLAVIEYQKGHLITARNQLEEILLLFNDSISSFIKIKTYYYLGNIYQDLGIYDRSIYCFNELVNITEYISDEEFEKASHYYGESFNLLGIAHLKNSSIDKAISYLQDYRSISQFDDYQKALFLINSSEAWFSKGLIDSTRSKYYRLNEVLSSIELEEFYCICELGIARLELESYNVSVAKKFLDKADKTCKDFDRLMYYDNLGDYYLKKDQKIKALEMYQRSIQSAYFLPENKNADPNFSAYFKLEERSATHLSDLLEVISSYTETAFATYHASSDVRYLNLAFEAFNYFDHIYIENIQNLLTDESKYHLIKNTRATFEQAVEVCYQLAQQNPDKQDYYINAAFKFAERIRANILHSNVLKGDAQNVELIPDSLKYLIQGVKSEIRFFQNQLSNKPVEVNKNDLSRQISALEIRLDKLLTDIETNYPSYAEVVQNRNDVIDIDSLQRGVIKKQDVLLEYFTTQSDIYIFGITPNESAFLKVEKTVEFKSQLALLLKSISDKNFIDSDYIGSMKTYLSSSYAVYETLVRDILLQLNSPKGHLLVIPDGQLNYLPVATLVENNVQNISDAIFLINRYNISYDYSAKSYVRNKKRPRADNLKHTLCAFTPNYEQSKYANLSYNKDEISMLNRLFKKAVTYHNNNASKQSFEKSCSDCAILHLSVHGILNESKPDDNYLVFQPVDSTDYKLKISNIYRNNINSSLTVLSACNTAMGKFKESEGVISISNAFSYAGSSAVWSSLWPAHEKVIYDMSTMFYKLMKKGETLSFAVSQAQRSHIQANLSNELSHPYYWGNMILTGNDDKMYASTAIEWYIVFLVLAAFLLIGIGIKV